MYVRRTLRVHAGKSWLMVFLGKEVEVLTFNTSYKVNAPVAESCVIVLGDNRREVVNEFKYLGTVLCRHGEMDEEMTRVVKGRGVV